MNDAVFSVQGLATHFGTAIETGIEFAILRGVFREGDRLPNWRGLAIRLHVDPDTVAVAYRKLERDGAVEFCQGLGVFVAPGGAAICANSLRKMLAGQLDNIVEQARQANLSDGDVRELVEQKLAESSNPSDDAHGGGAT